ncbi:MAG: hypothetical protein K5865_04270, partial [Eubacterium sp.]|nr:hypothetical protein [Eubacterium sp.]
KLRTAVVLRKLKGCVLSVEICVMVALDSKNRGSAESRCILRSRIKAFRERLAYRGAIWHNKIVALRKTTYKTYGACLIHAVQ